MKKYMIILMSLLIVSTVQLHASLSKSAKTAAVAASTALAGYYGLNQNQQNSVPAISASNIKNSYTSKSKKSDESLAQSKKAAIESANAKIQSYTWWFNGLDQSSQIFMNHLTGNLSHDQFIAFIDKLSNKKIYMDDAVDAYFAVKPKDYDEFYFPFFDENAEIVEDLINEKLLPQLKATAIHESGHALMTVLLSGSQKLYYASIIPTGRSRGHNIINESRFLIDRFDSFKHQILINLSGGIAVSVKDRKKLTFQEFLSMNGSSEGYGIGDRYDWGTDIYDAYKNAEQYIDRSESYALYFASFFFNEHERKLYTDQREQKIHRLLEQCYNEAYDIISAHEDRLDLMTDTLYKRKVLHATKLQEFVDPSKY